MSTTSTATEEPIMSTATATPIEPSQVYTSSRPYERSHLTEPRGRGSWAFCSYTGGVAEGEPVFFSGTLTEAKSAASKHFATLGIQDIAVLP
jgi:hypothetical protein